MKKEELRRALTAAVTAARSAGRVMRKNLHAPKIVNEESQHDIKLELDVRCQKLIERTLRRAFPAIALLGEEGESGAVASACRWVVDPIDGTVNYAHTMPHAAVSIALQVRTNAAQARRVVTDQDFVTVLGVVFDPFTDELWTALRGEPARLNGRPIRVSRRATLGEAVISIGFSKTKSNLSRSLPLFCSLSRRARKIRIMGSAALALAYVATGRFDGYLERRISLWDVAAGGLLVECAGGKFLTKPIAGYHRYSMVASNGRLGGRFNKPV